MQVLNVQGIKWVLDMVRTGEVSVEQKMEHKKKTNKKIKTKLFAPKVGG